MHPSLDTLFILTHSYLDEAETNKYLDEVETNNLERREYIWNPS